MVPLCIVKQQLNLKVTATRATRRSRVRAQLQGHFFACGTRSDVGPTWTHDVTLSSERSRHLAGSSGESSQRGEPWMCGAPLAPGPVLPCEGVRRELSFVLRLMTHFLNMTRGASEAETAPRAAVRAALGPSATQHSQNLLSNYR